MSRSGHQVRHRRLPFRLVGGPYPAASISRKALEHHNRRACAGARRCSPSLMARPTSGLRMSPMHLCALRRPRVRRALVRDVRPSRPDETRRGASPTPPRSSWRPGTRSSADGCTCRPPSCAYADAPQARSASRTRPDASVIGQPGVPASNTRDGRTAADRRPAAPINLDWSVVGLRARSTLVSPIVGFVSRSGITPSAAEGGR
jgi:hypothetical protein